MSFLEGEPELLLVDLGLGFDRDGDDGVRRGDGLEEDLVLRIAQGVAGVRGLETHARRDVPA